MTVNNAIRRAMGGKIYCRPLLWKGSGLALTVESSDDRLMLVGANRVSAFIPTACELTGKWEVITASHLRNEN